MFYSEGQEGEWTSAEDFLEATQQASDIVCLALVSLALNMVPPCCLLLRLISILGVAVAAHLPECWKGLPSLANLGHLGSCTSLVRSQAVNLPMWAHLNAR